MSIMEMSEYERHKYELERKAVEAKIKREEDALKMMYQFRTNALSYAMPALIWTMGIALMVSGAVAGYTKYNTNDIRENNAVVQCIESVPVNTRSGSLTDAQRRTLLFDCFEIEV